MQAGGVMSGRRRRLVGSGVKMPPLSPPHVGVRGETRLRGRTWARASGGARATAWTASVGSGEYVGGCVSPRAVGCAVGFRVQPFASAQHRTTAWSARVFSRHSVAILPQEGPGRPENPSAAK